MQAVTLHVWISPLLSCSCKTSRDFTFRRRPRLFCFEQASMVAAQYLCRRGMSFHEQPVLYSVDLSGCTAMSALTPETVTATFVSALESAGATVVQALSH